MPVGGFPGIQSHLTRTTRAPVNPVDISTIISIFPKEINETKLTISPSKFHLDAGTFDHPAILIVGSSSWWKMIDDEQPILEIPCGSTQVAKAVVNDYCNGLVGCNMSSSMPGLFWLPGEFNAVTLRAKHQAALDTAKKKQDKFWNALVRFADTFWARTNGSPLCISDEMRLAARELGLAEQKEWMRDFTMLAKTNCPACGNPVKPGYPVCSNCHAIIDPEQAKKLGIQFSA
jgi:hypothetical protein